MWKKALLVSLASCVVGLAASDAQAVTVGLKVDSIQRLYGGMLDNVTLAVTLTNETKVKDVIAVNVSVTVVCPFRPTPISVRIPFSVTLKPGESVTRKVTIPIPHPKLLKPLDVTIAATAKGATSKTQSASSVSFKLNP